MIKASTGHYGVYFDATKSTSGQRFFERLSALLTDNRPARDQRLRAILFNVSAPLTAILEAKLRSRKVVLRIDSLYFDRLSPEFLSTFAWPLRALLSLGLEYPRLHDLAALVANLLNENYTAFARILLADHVIYQSTFSRTLHQRYFPRKPFDIVVNGAPFVDANTKRGPQAEADEIRTVTIHDAGRPSKRIHVLVDFVRWVREKKALPIRLTIVGYTGTVVACAPPEVKTLIETASFIDTLPRFRAFEGDVQHALSSSDVYCTLTYRDACPNTVVEAMAHGLPVVGIASGGLPDIVRDAGILVPADDFADGVYSAHRFECDFPPIDFEKVLDAILTVRADLDRFRARVRERFEEDLDIGIVAARYDAVMRRVSGAVPRAAADNEISGRG